MTPPNLKYIYGPVASWRLGSSLGIDPLSCGHKVCSFDCIYCQLGKTAHVTTERKVFVPAVDIIAELRTLPPVTIDYITFSGTGEPTLAANIGEIIQAIQQVRPEKIAVLTNSSLLGRPEVQQDLVPAAVVVAKLDAASQRVFKKVNRPPVAITFEETLQGLHNFRRVFKGTLALQIMFVRENKQWAKDIARCAKTINPDEVQINTPLRPCEVQPLSADELNTIAGHFRDLPAVSVYSAHRKHVCPLSNKDTLARRGKV